METTDFQDILEEVADSVTALDPENLASAEFAAIRRAASRRLATAWEYHYWPDLMRVEQRYFRPSWYWQPFGWVKGAQVYFIPSAKYYQALQTAVIEPPAVLTDGEYVVNGEFWAEVKAEYTADYYDADATYAIGDQVRNPADGKYYQRVGGVIASDAGSIEANDSFALTHKGTDGISYDGVTVTNGVQAFILGTAGNWLIFTSDEVAQTNTILYSATDLAAETVDEVTGWVAVDGFLPAPTFTTAGAPPTLPTETSPFWGLLEPLDRYVSYTQVEQTEIGIVAAVYNINPRASTRAVELAWTLNANGVQVTSAADLVWIEFRIRCPRLSGDVFDASATYAAGKQVYYSDASTRGNFYIANAQTDAGESPVSAAAKWDVVEIPRTFHTYLVHGVTADWIRGPGGGAAEDAALENAMAQAELDEQKSLLVGQQSQRIRTVVRTR